MHQNDDAHCRVRLKIAATPSLQSPSIRSRARACRYLAIAGIATTFACAGPPQLTSELELKANPSGNVPLSALLRFTTDRPARVTLAVDSGDSREEVTPSQAFSTEHEVMVLGARPDRRNRIVTRAVGPGHQRVERIRLGDSQDCVS